MYRTVLVTAISVLGCAAQTTAVYQPASLTSGPFPSNVLTISDISQKTGLRVNLPPSEDACDLTSNAVVCGNEQLVNSLDGFSVNSRLMVCFSGPINTATVANAVSLTPIAPAGPATTINQTIFDPVSNCLYAKPNQILAQDTTYLLAVKKPVLDANGGQVGADPNFTACLKHSDPYCRSVAAAVASHGGSSSVVSASVFTTMSATAWLEAARRLADTLPAVVLPAGANSVFNLAQVQSITWNADQSGLPPQSLPLAVLGGVGQVAFGLFVSPNFLGQTQTINFGPTTAPLLPSTLGPPVNIVSYHVFLPGSNQPKKAKIPVVIYGHGLGDAQFGAPTFIAGKLAQNGFATLAIEIPGHGYGPGSTVTVTTQNGKTSTELTPGRGVLLPGNTTIGQSDGCILVGTAIATRDCNLQTAVDLAAIVNAIRKTNGLGLNLDPNRIYYVGQSEGSIYGTIFQAVEPNVHAAVLSVGGGSNADIARLAISARPLGLAYAGAMGVANVPPAQPEPYFNDFMNDNYVFRDQPVVVNNVPGALAVQAAFESADWIQMLGDPLSFAPHLKLNPLPGVPPKSTLFLFSKGDLEVPNPTNSALIRAAGGQSTSWYLLFDKAIAAAQQAGYNDLFDPHPSLSFPTIFSSPDQYSIAMAEQQQVASFFASNGNANPDPNQFLTAPFAGLQLFEIPSTLPETLNYFQLSPNNSTLAP